MQRLFIAVILTALVIGTAGCTVHSDSRARDDAEKAAQEAKENAREAAEEAKAAGREAAEEGRRAAEEARREADDARREALQNADEAKREALQNADEARREADDARREALQNAGDARERTEQARESAMARNRSHHAGGSSGDVVNINSATPQQIADATGVTTDVANKIVAARPYVSKRDLVSKNVVDEQTYWKIQKNVTVMK